MSVDTDTIRLYDQKAGEYADLTDDGMRKDPRLAAFIAALPEHGHALDLGCGPGTSAALMAEAGLQVTAMDASRQMVALASEKPGVTAKQASFDDLDGKALYDGVWASFSLLHAPRSAMPRHLTSIRRALKPGGIFVIAVKTGRGAARDKLGRLYTYYEEDELTALLHKHGFVPGEITRGYDAGLSGEDAHWFSVMAHG